MCRGGGGGGEGGTGGSEGHRHSLCSYGYAVVKYLANYASSKYFTSVLYLIAL